MEIFQNNSSKSGIIQLITGFDPNELSKQQLNYAKALAVGSIATAVLFAAVSAWNLNLNIRFLGLSTLIGIAVFFVLLIANRTLFILSSGMKKWFITAIISYVIVYLIISITVVSNPVQYYFLIQNVDKTNVTTALDEMAAIELLKDQLNQSQLQVLRKLTSTFSITCFLFSMIPLILLFTFRKQQSPLEREVSIQRQGIERRLLEAKKELAELYSTPSSNKDEIHDPFFSVEESVTPNSEERMRKAITLQDEITHLTHVLNTQFP